MTDHPAFHAIGNIGCGKVRAKFLRMGVIDFTSYDLYHTCTPYIRQHTQVSLHDLAFLDIVTAHREIVLRSLAVPFSSILQIHILGHGTIRTDRLYHSCKGHIVFSSLVYLMTGQLPLSTDHHRLDLCIEISVNAQFHLCKMLFLFVCQFH